MASAKLLLGGASAALGVRVARSLYGRWRLLPAGDQARTAPLAEQTKDAALELRGAGDRERAEAELRAASENLAEALVQSAEADPEVGDEELRRLRTDLARELERLSAGDAGPAGSAPETSSRG